MYFFSNLSARFSLPCLSRRLKIFLLCLIGRLAAGLFPLTISYRGNNFIRNAKEQKSKTRRDGGRKEKKEDKEMRLRM